jgi:tetratricopeptide (TPR) repeat protein
MDPIALKANTFQEFLKISKDTLSWIYSIGHKLYTAKKGDDAYAIFHLLTCLNSLVCDYWIGLGFAQYLVGEAEPALHSFSMASILDPENPTSRYQSAKIYIERKEFSDALTELSVLEEVIQKYNLDRLKTSFLALKNQAQSLQALEGEGVS